MTLAAVVLFTVLVGCNASIKVSRDSIKDASIVEGLDHRNEGRLASAYLGFDNHVDFGVTRVLMDFDLSGLSSENLLKASLIIYFSDSRENYTPCKANSDGPGCGSAHIVTRPWNEGKQEYDSVEEGDSSWLFSSYPTEWSTPGGDFDSNAIGWMVPEPEGSQQVHFYLDTSRFKMYLDDPSSFHGFLLRDDNNPGHIELDMRECAILEDCSRCIARIAPRLELEFADPASPPANLPTRAPATSTPTIVPTPSPVQATRSPILSTNRPNSPPTNRPTQLPSRRPSPALTNEPTVVPIDGTNEPTSAIQASARPTDSEFDTESTSPGPSISVFVAPLDTTIPTLQPSIRVGKVCGRFTQNITMDEVISRDLIERTIESLLEFRSSRYIANTEGLNTDVALNELTQQQNETNLRVLTLMEYTVCYEQPLSVASLEKIQSYPSQLVFFLQLETERLDLEHDLRGKGIPVQEGGLTSAMLLIEEDKAREASHEGDNNQTLIMAVAVGACAVVVGVLLIVLRKKMNKSKDSSDSPDAAIVPIPVQTTIRANELPEAFVELAKDESAVASVDLAHSEALDFKMQAESVSAEQETSSHHENETDGTVA